MTSELDQQMENYLKPLFGDMAQMTILTQKEKLGLSGEIEPEQYKAVAEEIKKMCNDMAGEIIANKIYTGLLSLIEKEN